MRILIATPLYPPDIEPAAQYVKELARQLVAHHSVTVVAYTRLPEKVEGVHIISVDKRLPSPLRVFLFFLHALSALRNTDVILLQNGPSTELPTTAAALILNKPFLLSMSDRVVLERSQGFIARFGTHLAKANTKKIISAFPSQKPLIFPLEPFPTEAIIHHQTEWDTHLTDLADALAYACKQ